MSFRIATLNLEVNEKRWTERRELIIDQLVTLKPDVLALNEVWLPTDTGQWLQEIAEKKLGSRYALVQQSKTATAPQTEAEALLARFPVIEQSHRYYSAQDRVALVARLQIDARFVDVYVTHLYPVKYSEADRLGQVKELLQWIGTRPDAEAKIVCGDFNAPLGAESINLFAQTFRPTQTKPTAFTPLRDVNGSPTHEDWPRFDRCIDFIWISDCLKALDSGLCFNQPAKDDPTLWPSDHIGVWADLELV